MTDVMGMNKEQRTHFELYVMDFAENCKTVADYESLSRELHESVENAIQDLCMDGGIDDYSPCF